MTRTFDSGPAIAPDGPLKDPPTIEDRASPRVAPRSTAIADGQVRKQIDGGQITVRRMIEMLQLAIFDNPGVIDFMVDAEGCDCVGDAHGIEVDLVRGTVLISREAGR